jgi:hypothetical protein
MEMRPAKPQAALRAAALGGKIAGNAAVRNSLADSFLGLLVWFAHGGLLGKRAESFAR